jgi:phage tail sheath protein FI
MLAYRTPDVYFEWLDTRPPPLVPLRTDIAGFVGIAARGPLHRPVKVESWTQFTSVFGAHIPQGYLAYAVEGFFENGGKTCWVVRVADPAQACPASLDIQEGAHWPPVLRLIASSPGVWGQRVTVTIAHIGEDRFNLTLELDGGGQEIWRSLSLDQDDARNVRKVLNDSQTGSRLVKARDPHAPAGGAAPPPELEAFEQRVVSGRLGDGCDGLETLNQDHFAGQGLLYDPTQPCERKALYGQPWGLRALEHVDEVNIIAMPDIMVKPTVQVAYKEQAPRCGVLVSGPFFPPPPEMDPKFPPEFSAAQILYLQNALIGQCHQLKDRVAILDTRLADRTPHDAVAWRNAFDTKYAALYYPWLLVPDPLRLEGRLLRPVPPCGHVAGVYARSDLAVGVHKPPANQALKAVKDVRDLVDDLHHGDLNTRQVNVIRSINGRGVRIAGARTLSSESEWRYVNVRRLMIMIEEGIDEQLQWMVFEPNNPGLWRDVDRVVRSFLDLLWRRAVLDGATAEEAYYVRCDESTNPPRETEQGRLICEIGVQPPWPAEFVVVRIGMTEGGVEVLEESS